MQLLLFSFSKRQNSTAIPADSTGVAVDVTLKNETSMNSPVFLLSGARPNYNYAKFDGAYYFIDDIRSVRNNLYELVCSIDILGTYRTEIGATVAYVERCAGGNGDLQDDLIVPGASTSVTSASADIGISRTGCFLLSCVGVTGVQTYIMSQSELQGLLSDVQNWADNLIQPAASELDALKVIGTQIISAGNAMDCIRDCRWVPFDDIPGLLPAGGISLGLYHIMRNPLYVSEAITTKSFDLTIPFTRNGFLRLKPYTEVQLYLPFVGNVIIDSPRLANTTNLHINFSRNNRSGEIGYQVLAGGAEVGCYGGATAIPVPVGISNITPQSLIASIGGAAVAAGYNPIGAVGSALSMQSSVSSVGAIQGGAGAGLPGEIYLNVVERSISGQPGNMAAVQGIPECEARLLSSITGYCKTRGASVSGAIRGALRDRINSMLDAGFFRE